MKIPEHLKKEHGMALILVLWIISLMSIMATSFSLSTRQETQMIHHSIEKLRLEALAEGGAHFAMQMLNRSDAKERWIADGRAYLWNVSPDIRIEISIFDEGGKFDLNTLTDESMLTITKMVLGEEKLALEVSDAILDWRDGDDLSRPHGAELRDYTNRQAKSSPQNRNFLALEELGNVAGVTPEIMNKLTPWFTIYTSQGSINPQHASREILLGMAKGNNLAVDTFISGRESGQNVAFPPVPGLVYNPANIDLAYSLQIVASQQESGIKSRLMAIVKKSQSGDSTPFQVLSWKKE